MTQTDLLLVNLFITAINIILLGLVLKLYTEILKDQSMNRRSKSVAPPAGGCYQPKAPEGARPSPPPES